MDTLQTLNDWSFQLTLRIIQFTVFGALLAPVAGMSCWLIALLKGWSKLTWAVQGACASVLMIAPWLYLLSRMLGIPVPRRTLYAAYVAVYVAWLLGPIANMGVVILQELPNVGRYEVLWGIVMGLSILTWLTSQRSLLKRRIHPTVDQKLDGILPVIERSVFSKGPAYRDPDNVPGATVMPKTRLLLPWLFTLVWSVACLALWGLGFARLVNVDSPAG